MASIETAIEEQVKSTLKELGSKGSAKPGSQSIESEKKKKMETELARRRSDIQKKVIRELENKNPVNKNNRRDYYDRWREQSRERRRSESSRRRPRSRSRDKRKKSPKPKTKMVELRRVESERRAQSQSLTRQEQQLQKKGEQHQQQKTPLQRQQTQLEVQLRQQQGTSYPAHKMEPAMSYTGSKPALTRRTSLENRREQHYPMSPETTSSKIRRSSGGTSAEQQLWLQPQRQCGKRRETDIGDV